MDGVEPPRILAVDPGREKCGIAVVSRLGTILHRSIVPTLAVVDTVRALVDALGPAGVVCGTGTGSKTVLRDLQAAQLRVPLTGVDEAYTSEAARARYVAENPPKGLSIFLPRSLRTPPVPYDDYVAIILAERYWAEQSKSEPV